MPGRRVRDQEKLFPENRLFYGDNLHILRDPRYVRPESVDLVYLDPPFKPNEKYNVLFHAKGGTPAAAQVRAFEDTWHWDQAAEAALHDTMENAPSEVGRTLQGLRSVLDNSDMFAYLCMMAPRLVEMHKVLKPTGSIYLHCDPAASHYLKVLMDSIFGPTRFKNEVVWSYKRYTASATQFQRLHDILLFYGKGPTTSFNPLRDPYGSKSGKADSHYKQAADGRWFRWQKRKGRDPYKIYLSEGRRLGDVWDIPIINASARERLGYPTQKPEPLLERLITASTNEGDLVLDPFCGCGTTIAVAQRLGRLWIGIDIAYDAIRIIRERLAPGVEYSVFGEPESLEDAEKLAAEDPYQFQWWAVRRLGARETQFKKGADKGIDGRLFLRSDRPDGFAEAIISVKAGHTGRHHVHELRGVMEREEVAVGVLVTLRRPTPAMRAEAATAGGYVDEDGWWYPRLQIITAADVIAGSQIEYPADVKVTRETIAPTGLRMRPAALPPQEQ